MKADNDMKATTGIYDAGLGNASNEKSGVAIRQRQMESDVATSIYSDNMAKAIAQAGRIIIEMIPKVYDTQRALRILGKDGAENLVHVNQRFIEGGMPIVQNDLTIGKYDVRVSVGPNYTTLRQETAEGMLNFVQSFPQAGAVTADLIAKAQDWPDADQFAERLRTLLPPGLADAGEDADPAALQSQIAQMGAAMEEMQARLQGMEHAKGMAEIRRAEAEAVEAEADAEKATVEAQEAAMELAIKSGAMNGVIEAAVRAQIAQMLQGAAPL